MGAAMRCGRWQSFGTGSPILIHGRRHECHRRHPAARDFHCAVQHSGPVGPDNSQMRFWSSVSAVLGGQLCVQQKTAMQITELDLTFRAHAVQKRCDRLLGKSKAPFFRSMTCRSLMTLSTSFPRWVGRRPAATLRAAPRERSAQRTSHLASCPSPPGLEHRCRPGVLLPRLAIRRLELTKTRS
jgi:hypothetical protein